MPREILLASNAHNQHWELSMATNLETVLVKIQPPNLGLVVMHVILKMVFQSVQPKFSKSNIDHKNVL